MLAQMPIVFSCFTQTHKIYNMCMGFSIAPNVLNDLRKKRAK